MPARRREGRERRAFQRDLRCRKRRHHRLAERLGRGDGPWHDIGIAHAEETLSRAHLQTRPLHLQRDLVLARRLARRGERAGGRREPDDVVTADVVGRAAEAGGKIVGVGHRDAAGLFGEVTHAFLSVDQLAETTSARGCDFSRVAASGVVSRLQPSALQAPRVNGVDDNPRTRCLLDQPIESGAYSRDRLPGSIALRVALHDREALAQQDHRPATGQIASAADEQVEGAKRARGAHLVPQILDLVEVQGVVRAAVFTHAGECQRRLEWDERFHAIARVERPPHRVDLRVQQPVIGGERSQRAAWRRRAYERDEVAALDSGVDVLVQRFPCRLEALERQAQVVYHERDRSLDVGARHRRRLRLDLSRLWRWGFSPARVRLRKRRLSPAVLRRGCDGNELGERQRNEVPVLSELEVVRCEVRDDPPIPVCDDSIDPDDVDADTENGCIGCGMCVRCGGCLSLPDERARGQ